MFPKNVSLLLLLLGVVKAKNLPESTTIKVLMPPSSDFEDDDAVIINSDNSTDLPVDLTPESFNVQDCFLPKVKGPCRAVIEQYYYNSGTKSCDIFQWSGCGGNNNRFSEKEFCQQHCSTKTLTMKKKVNSCGKFEGCGPLKCGTIKDPLTGCEKCACGAESVQDVKKEEVIVGSKVIVGSVSGNKAIPLPEEIPAGIKPKPEEVCHLPETRGNCRAMMTRWRYNPELKECTQFHFGGCDGNPNNFVSLDKCSEFCRGQ